MQAQDYPMAKWAIGIRLPGSTNELIETSLNNGEILRTHLMRPTWHFVSSDDIYWMLELTAPRIRSSLKFREKWLGLTEAIVSKSKHVIEKVLSPDEHLTRDELIAQLNNAKIKIDGYRGSHLLMRSELDGLICSGKMKGAKQTYALLEKRVPKKKRMGREDSLEKLAQKYFASHGPATLHDFARWSGLSMNDSRNALEMIKSKFVSDVVGENTYWSPGSLSIPKERTDAFVLPAFDEFLVGYKDRSASLNHGIEKKIISENGIFRPAIIIKGQVTGLWKRTMPARRSGSADAGGEEGQLIVETKFFRAHTKKERSEIHRAAERFGKFLCMTVDCRV